MATSIVWVTTGQGLAASSCSAISITLVGAHGESPKHRLDHQGKDFAPGAVDEYQVPSTQSLGPIVLIQLHKQPYSFFPTDSWLCNCVQVMSPEGDTYRFPCYQWIEGYCTMELREGASVWWGPCLRFLGHGMVSPCASPGSWKEYAPGCLRCLDLASVDELDSNDKYSLIKTTIFMLRTIKMCMGRTLTSSLGLWGSGVLGMAQRGSTPSPEYVSERWQEDSFFGYQFLNGVNPVVMRKCTSLPENFPMTEEMVASSLGEGTTLQNELKVRRSCRLQDPGGDPTTPLNGEQEYLAAPLCLLHLTPGGQVMPLAIQLSQRPDPGSPIFLPSDPVWDWTLAKIWLRLAKFHAHAHSHQFGIYPLKISRFLPLFQASSTGQDGMLKLLAKGMENVSYEVLCLPDNLEACGVISLPNYYYWDDGMRLWTVVENFVSGIIELYYQSDATVEKDSELQAWVAEIFTDGFYGQEVPTPDPNLYVCVESSGFRPLGSPVEMEGGGDVPGGARPWDSENCCQAPSGAASPDAEGLWDLGEGPWDEAPRPAYDPDLCSDTEGVRLAGGWGSPAYRL
uniref:Uncharacterized protein n=1 Tax=Chelonoidis abingdonii TaxID=106734 RepID=A0A8C0GZ78_CHEAB